MQRPPDLHPLPASVVVVGTSGASGAGKPTFARRLAALAGSPHVELDAARRGSHRRRRRRVTGRRP